MNFKELGENLGLEEEEYRELIELFVESGSADYQRLLSALAAGDADQVMRSAHTIKGASLNLGLAEVGALAKNIEQKAGNAQIDRLTALVQALGAHFKDMESLVRS